jgi:membrane protease YdiL (CAAX protease family)
MTAARLTLARHHTATGPALQPVLAFAAVALPVGWVLLSVPVVLGLPQEPFVLAALLLGLILPALVLTARESGRAGVRALLRDAVRLPRPLWWGPVAALALPAVVWTVALIGGGARPLSLSLLGDAAFALVLSAVVINIWEEMVWTGFVQRRLTAHGGELRGSTLTAFLFAGIHLPLAFDGARGPGDVLLGVTVLIGTGLGLRLLISRLDRWSGRSLLTVGLLHAGFNTGADLVEPGYDWVRIVVTVLLGVAVLALRRRSMSPA